MSDLAGQLRALPSVDEVVSHLEGRYPRRLLVDETRRVIAALRDEIRGGREVDAGTVEGRVIAALDALDRPTLRPVINATGVVLHTNLGRAPLPAIEFVGGYSNLEYDLGTGRRGKRDVHAAVLMERLLGRPGIVVNNNAAAVYLTLNELAAGGEVVISRGELIEIGDGFRIPDIMARAGAVLREVGTTNRTRLDDYRAAISERTRLILRVHPSNFHVTGFTEKPALKDLAALARHHAIPLYEDLGSGCLVDLRRYGISEPLVAESLEAGVNIVSFSCDKLLGGPQAGIVAGDAALVERIRRNPMFRALRVDKLIYQALGATLRAILFERFEEIPAARMLALSPDAIRERAERLCAIVQGAEIVRGESVAGGGSTPDQVLPTWLIAIGGDAVRLEKRLRSGTPPVIARIADDRLVIDLRTVLPAEEEPLVAALQALS
jgi:L-seryl-tRNA(Ser) seleniumtransferase